MKEQYKIRGAHVRALALSRKIRSMKKEEMGRFLMRLRKRVESLLKDSVRKKELDLETLDLLKIYLDRRTGPLDVEAAIGRELDSSLNKFGDPLYDEINTMFLFLTSDGELYRKPKRDYCYPMTQSAQRLKIIRLLLRRTSFTPSKAIAKHLGTSPGAISFAIKRINDIARANLSLPEQENLIVSKNRGGYKLNHLYTISQK